MPKERAQRIVMDTLPRFRKNFGIAMCPSENPLEPISLNSVAMPWNQLIGEGLATKGFRNQAVDLVTSLMQAIIPVLKKTHAFRQYYLAETGDAVGVKNHLNGLAPVGLFLKTLGIMRLSSDELWVLPSNPFPWEVTVKYKGVNIVCNKKETMISFFQGQHCVVRGNTIQRVMLK